MTRALKNRLFYSLNYFAVALSLGVLLFLLGVILIKGIQSVNFDFLLTESSSFGAKGGILFQILGSLLLVAVAALISFPIAFGTAIFKSEYIISNSGKKMCNILIYGINGVPSIIFGIFGLIVFVNLLDTGISWFIGSIILAMMILPTITIAAYQTINGIPESYRESAYALGFTKWQVISKVLIPQGVKGAITGLLLGLARAIGETAPIMFIATAFSGIQLPSCLFEPVVTLPTHILALAQQATNSQALANAWGSSFVLICLVLIFSISALYSRIKYAKK
jgi:phosphate transport system permease protein